MVLYVGEFIGCALFVVLFLLRSRWWQTSMGRNVLAMMFVLAVLQGLSLVRLVVAEEWFAEHQVAIRFWSFLALFIVVWWRVIILIKIQHDDGVAARQRREEEDDKIATRPPARFD
jgi:hypothetical protein